jgi:integrase
VLEHRKAPVISKMIDDLLQEKERAGRRETTIHTLECFLCEFAASFGDRQLHTVTLPELNEVCLVPELAPRTQFNRSRMMSHLYNYALRKKWVSVNLAKDIVIPEWDPAEPGVLLVEQVQQLLRHADEFGFLPYIGIGLFAGLRRCELMKLDWTAVKRLDREIVVDASIAKTRSRRVVSYDDALTAWLELCPAGSGPIVDAKTFGGRFDRLRKAAGIQDWPHNALRHSFASYHLALHKDSVRTAFLMGHTGGTDMLHNNYKGLVSTADAQRFWALTPAVVLSADDKAA